MLVLVMNNHFETTQKEKWNAMALMKKREYKLN